VKGTGATYGNPEIRAGKIIKAEGLGNKFSGKYFVISAKHELVPLRGYRTAFSFISSLGSPVQAGTGVGGAAAQQFGEPAGKEETRSAAGAGTGEEQEEKKPKITNLKWMKDGQAINTVMVKDSVVLTANVQDIDEGSYLRITIWEKDKEGEDDLIARMSCQAKDGKVEFKWKVKYVQDTDDKRSEKEKGYNPPEYVFTVEKMMPKIKSDESPLLEVKGWIRGTFKNKKTGEIYKNQKYVIVLPDGKTKEGKTDNNGKINEKDLIYGKYYIFLKKE
jgi:hypothetical protein